MRARSRTAARREIGMIFQEPLTRLNPLMRFSGHFEETIKQHSPDLQGRDPGTGVRGAAPDGDPADPLRSYPHEFSGGMRQRLMIA